MLSFHSLDDTLHKHRAPLLMEHDVATTATTIQAIEISLPASRHQSRNLQDDNGFFPFFAFFLMCWVTILLVKKCCCSRDNRPAILVAPPPASSPPAAPQLADASNRDLLSSLTPEERRAYVSDLLKSEKYKASAVDVDETSVESNFATAHDDMDSIVADIEGDVELGAMSKLDSSRSNCAICLDSYNDGDLVCSSNNTGCGHRFHRMCMFDWLQKHEECPCCRRSYLHPDINESSL